VEDHVWVIGGTWEKGEESEWLTREQGVGNEWVTEDQEGGSV
jgi:hypothetical protein